MTIFKARILSRIGRVIMLLAAPLLLPCSAAAVTPVQQQLDQLIAMGQGKRLGVITNPSGCDEAGNSDVDYLTQATGTTITAFFAPEHGLRASLPPGVSEGDYIDPETSIPVYAVYGTRNAPTNAQLANVDILVFDLQDVGVRFYTFVWTMTYCMEAAASNGKTFVVIDRPNPIGGLRVEGVPNTVDYGIVGRLGAAAAFGVSTRHGMTAGEIAKMWNQEWLSPKVSLQVITMPNWQRSQWWTDTGRVFVNPSPNMRSPAAAAVYPGTCIFESTNVSEGRGTNLPFENLGAPFINGAIWASSMNALGLPGVTFSATSFTPTTSKWSGQLCSGILVTATNRDTFDPIRTGMYLLQTAYQLYPSNVTISSYAAKLMGVSNLQNRIKTENVDSIIGEWTPLRNQFLALRSQYLLYPESVSSVSNWKEF